MVEKLKKLEPGKYDKFIVNIQGKQYMTVAGRICEFWDLVKEQGVMGSISTEVAYEGKEIRAKATAVLGKIDVTGVNHGYGRMAVGHASEVIGDSFINKDSALENCETSAIGRCLGNLGLGLISSGGVASADEVKHAISKQQTRTSSPQNTVILDLATPDQVGQIKQMVGEFSLTSVQKAGIRRTIGATPEGDLTKAQADAYLAELTIMKKEWESIPVIQEDEPPMEM